MIDLAAIVPPDLDMPPGYELTNGAYIALERVHAIATGWQAPVGALVGAYEATYEQRHGGGFMEVQILQFAETATVDLDLVIANGSLDRMAAESDFAEDNLMLLDPDLRSVVHSGIVLEEDDGEDRVFPVCAVAYAIGALSVRAIWHAAERVNDIAMRSAPQGANRAALAAVERFQIVQSGAEPEGIDLELPRIVPLFSPPATFENYLHRASRYSLADKKDAAVGFKSCYRRGWTDAWVAHGSARRLHAVDVLRFGESEQAAEAVQNKSGLMATWMLEHTFIPIDRGLPDALLYAYEHASGTWNGVLFQAIGNLIWCVDIWGYPNLEKTETIATRIMLALIEASENQVHPIEIGPELVSLP